MPGLFTSLGLCGFFGATIGPILAEATCIVAGTKQYNIAFGWLMLATGIGMLIGPPIGGMHHLHHLKCYKPLPFCILLAVRDIILDIILVQVTY